MKSYSSGKHSYFQDSIKRSNPIPSASIPIKFCQSRLAWLNDSMNVWAFKYQIREVKYQQNVASDVANTSKDAGKLSSNSACSKSHSKCIEREIDPIEISSNKPNSSLDILGGLNESGGTSLIEMARVSSVSLVENYGAPPSSKSWVERESVEPSRCACASSHCHPKRSDGCHQTHAQPDGSGIDELDKRKVPLFTPCSPVWVVVDSWILWRSSG